MAIFGLLNLDKPSGMTSRDVVNRVQRMVRPAKVGHAGTLDPLATGVLIACLGPATRLVPYLQSRSKQYQATFLLGRHSASDDIEEEVELLPHASVPSLEEIEAALPRFVGHILQRPPAFSAVKVRGRRAYSLARSGEQVQVKERVVVVERLSIVSYQYPQLELAMTCGSGTYVRSLGRDLAESLGTAAVMQQLRRTAVGPFAVTSALRLEDLSASQLSKQMLPAAMAVDHLPQLEISPAELKTLERGQTIRRPAHGLSGEIAALNSAGVLVSILSPADRDRFKPVRNFGSA